MRKRGVGCYVLSVRLFVCDAHVFVKSGRECTTSMHDCWHALVCMSLGFNKCFGKCRINSTVIIGSFVGVMSVVSLKWAFLR